MIEYYLERSGFESSDAQMKRLVALAAQKFLSDVSHDAAQYAKMRGSTGSKKKAANGELTLTMDDLANALKEYGVNVAKPAYFADKS